MKCASETCAMPASVGTSSGWAYVRSIASRARSIRRLDSSTARLTAVDSADPPPYRRWVPGHLYHSPNQTRTGARQAVRRPATGPGGVLALQRQVGNRAVRRTLARAPSLNESAPTGTFTADALKYFNDPANKAKG